MKTAILYAKVFVGNVFKLVFSRRDPSRGYFIIMDGGEGSGKGTMIEWLKKKYPEAVFSREPGGTPYAEEIRGVMLKSPYAKEANGRTQLLLVSAGRSDHMARNAEIAILSGKHFVSDRGDSTSFGYQVGGQEGGYVVKKLLFDIRKAVYEIVSPDLYVILEVDPEEGAKRVAARKGEVNHFDERKRDFHDRVSKAYRIFARLFPGKVKFVNANKTREEVFAQLDAVVGPFLSSKPAR